METVNAIDQVCLQGMLLKQIEQTNFLGQNLGFRLLLLQDLFIHILIYLLVSYRVDSKIDIITANLRLRLASNDVNLEPFEYFLFKTIQMLQKNSAPFLVSILKTSASIIKNYGILQGKTSTDLKNNIKYDKQAPHNHINNLEMIIVDRDKVIPLKDNIL